ncbi:hypothetical protein MKW98_012930 [Papaver atlanticum]|uniref:Uncharacterized protein n=1 Tax=Papaver atlanticum TaxID=357466 RepID=A0AAD4XFT7_9MAGN|nr:hypothetical protein MKW98_012930 [Papaver atlanticum]
METVVCKEQVHCSVYCFTICHMVEISSFKFLRRFSICCNRGSENWCLEDLRGVGCTLKDRVELVHKNGVDVGELAGRGNNRGMQRWDDVVMKETPQKESQRCISGTKLDSIKDWPGGLCTWSPPSFQDGTTASVTTKTGNLSLGALEKAKRALKMQKQLLENLKKMPMVKKVCMPSINSTAR